MFCSIHVASVLQMVHMLLCHGGFLKTNAFMGTLHLSTYWSAIIHDFQHGGVNNDFLIKTAHPIALTYNDQSPLENHHLATAFQVFLDPQCQYVRVSLDVYFCRLWPLPASARLEIPRIPQVSHLYKLLRDTWQAAHIVLRWKHAA